MSNKKIIDTKSLLQELEKLMEITGNNCGPLLINELQLRIDQTINIFNKDVEKLIQNSFDKYNSKVNRCKQIVNNKQLIDRHEDDNNDEDTTSPHFIKQYEKKAGKKL